MRGALETSAATLDRLLRPPRVEHRRRTTTRPDTILRQGIALRTHWTEDEPGFLEIDTVVLCGGTLDDRHAWMFDAVDIETTWNEMPALENRSKHGTITQLGDVEKSLPFALAGLGARLWKSADAVGPRAGERRGPRAKEE